MAASSSRSNIDKPSLSKDDKGRNQGQSKRGRGNVDDGWGGLSNYMDAKMQKLANQFVTDKQTNHSNFFEGVRIYINGYTKPSSDELRRIMLRHGGKYEMYLSKSRVTHIVATNLPNSKLHQAKSLPVVKPEWITESVAAGKRLSHVDYLLFGNQSKLQPGLSFGASVPSIKNSSSTSSRHVEQAASTHVAKSVGQENLMMFENEENACGGELPENVLARGSPGKSVVEESERSDWKEKNLSLEFDGQKCKNDKNSQCTENATINFMKTDRTSEFVKGTLHMQPASNIVEKRAERYFKRDDANGHSSSEDSDIVFNSDEDCDSPRKLSLTHLPVRTKSNIEGSPLYHDSYYSEKTTERSGHIVDLSSNIPANEISHHLSTFKDNYFNKTSEKADSPVTRNETGGHKLTNAASSHHLQSPPSSNSMAKAGEKGFLSEYYSNSRLHHLSSWGAEFKAYVAEIQKNKCVTFPGQERLRQAHENNMKQLDMAETLETTRHNSQDRTVMHIDMDCFFVSVGLLSRPELRGKPVAVTHSRGQGVKPSANSDAAWEKAEWHKKRNKELKGQTSSKEDQTPGLDYDHLVPKGSTGAQTFHSMAGLASCSYEARRKGVKNGMFMGRAKSLCPDLQTITYDFDEYNRISRILYDTVASYTHDIEAVSCDEMLVDCTDLLASTGATALEFASLLRSEVMDKTGCPASTGIGPNILLAKLATRKAKPSGQFQVLGSEARHFIKEQSVSDLPGVGYSMSRKLAKLEVKTCGDLQAVHVSRLRTEFGPKTGESLHHFSMGHDDREIKSDKQRKSVSAEVNYGIRFTKEHEAVSFLQELSTEVQQRLARLKVKGQCITLKLMVRRSDAPQETAKFMGHGICNTFNKSTTLPVATNDGCLIGREVIAMYKSQNVVAADVRGIGIQIHKLEPENAKGYTVGKHHSAHQSILNFAVAAKGNAQSSLSPSKTTSAGTSLSAKSSACSSIGSISPSKRSDLSSVLVAIEAEKRASGSAGPSDRLLEDMGIDAEDSNNYEDPRNTSLSDRIDVNSLTDVSFLLSPSQVNSDVLNELPEEIADEIRADMKHHRKERSHPQSHLAAKPVHGQYADPGPSRESLTNSTCHGSSREMPHDTFTKVNSRHCSDPITDLPSMSQVDFACFQALPKHLQMELQAAYAKQPTKPHEAEDKRPTLAGTALGRLKSPTKDSKGKQKNNHKRRGRPPGKRKLAFTDHNTKITSVKHRTSDERDVDTAIADVIILDDSPELRPETPVGEMQGVSNAEFNNRDIDPAPMGTSSSDSSEISFCGATTSLEVRHLLKEWLRSCPDPVEDDVSMVIDYLISLINAKLLEQAYCHLKFLKRRVYSSPALNSWRESIDIIASHIQSHVWDKYGSELKLF